MLARLVSNVGRPVSVDALASALWDGRPPPTAAKSLQVHVMRVRSFLEPGRPASTSRFIVRQGPGYSLTLTASDIDAGELAVRYARGRALLEQGAVAEARAELVAAVALRRGEPYADWPDASWAEAERRRLSELALSARTQLADADLALGRTDETVAALELLVGGHPYREEVWARLARALYAAGRATDALSAVSRARSVLVEDLGLDLGPELVELERQVLTHDPALLVPRPRSGSGPGAARPAAGACPWKGLASYESRDAALFHGREQLVAALTARLVDHDLVVLAGASGSGKSSVVRAGLVPALAAGALPDSADWMVRLVLPREHAGDALASLPDGAPCLLVVDQLEEVWSAGSASTAAAFLDDVIELLDRGRVTRVVAVVRGDHLHRLAEHPRFAARAGSGVVLATPLTAEELRRVVEQPAADVGLAVDPELVTTVVDDVAGAPGALPLLSTALVATWERRRGNHLELGGYLAAGGAAGAVARTAEDAWGQLDEPAREAARPLLLRLAGEGDGDRPVRRRVPLDELGLDGPAGEARWAVVETLVRRRLLAVDDGRLEVAHEALLTAWPRLAQWLAEDAEGRRLRAHLSPAARDWEAKGRPAEDLYRGARLAAALSWAADHDDQLVAVERDFLAAAQAAADAELARERAGRRRTRRLAAALAGALAVVLVAASLALVQRERADERALAAERATLVADANRLAATAGTATDLDLALLLATEAVRTADTPETQDGLLAALVEHRQAVSVFRTPSGMRPDVPAVAGDGRQLNLLTDAGSLLSWDLRGASAAPRLSTVHVNPYAMAASPVDGRIATLTDEALTIDGYHGPPVQPAYSSLGGLPHQVGWSPDGRVLVVLVDPEPGISASGRLHAVRLDARSGAVLSRTRPVAGDSGQVSTDGRTVLMWADESDSPPMLVDAELGRVRPLSRTSAQAEGDQPRLFGNMVAWLGLNGGITLSDRTSGRVRQRVIGHTSRVVNLRLSPDQRTAVSVGDDRRVVVWDVGPGSRLELRDVLAGHGGSVVDVAFSPDSARAYSASLDGTVIGWDLEDRLRFGTPTPTVPGRWISRRPVMAHGRWVAPTERLRDGIDAYEQLDVSLAFVDPRTGRTEATVGIGQADPITAYGSSVALSPDGERLVATAGTSIVVLDARSGQETGRITLDPPEPVRDAIWSRDGRSILVGASGLPSGDRRGRGGVVVVDAETMRPRGRIEVAFAVQSLATSPDGRLVAAALVRDRSLSIAELPSGHIRQQIQLVQESDGRVNVVDFSPDGTRIAAGDIDGLLHVIDVGSGQRLGEPARLHTGVVLDARWLDDATVATTGSDGRVVLYDVRRGLVRGQPIPFTRDGGEDGGYLVTASRDELVVAGARTAGRSFPLSVSSWMAHACSIAGRDLTAAEWASYVPSRPYRQTCG